MARKKSNTPRRLRMNRQGRLQSAKTWLPTYSGKNIVRGYARWFGVNLLCAIHELQSLGVTIAPRYVEQVRRTEAEKSRWTLKKKKSGSDAAMVETVEDNAFFEECQSVYAACDFTRTERDMVDEIPF